MRTIADSRLKIISQTNQGAHAAINRGLAEAAGEYLAILNSDDAYYSRRLEILVTRLKEDPEIGLIGSHIEVVDNQGNHLGIKQGYRSLEPWHLDHPERSFRAGNCLQEALLTENYYATTSNFVFRRRWYEQVGPFLPLRYTHDWDFALRIARDAKLTLVPEPLLRYRVHGSNTIRENQAAMIFEICWILAMHLPLSTTKHMGNTSPQLTSELLERLLHSIYTYDFDRVLTLLFLQDISKDLERATALLNLDNPHRVQYIGFIHEQLDCRNKMSIVPASKKNKTKYERDEQMSINNDVEYVRAIQHRLRITPVLGNLVAIKKIVYRLNHSTFAQQLDLNDRFVELFSKLVMNYDQQEARLTQIEQEFAALKRQNSIEPISSNPTSFESETESGQKKYTLNSLAKLSGDPFRVSTYFDQAEPDIDAQWKNLIWPMIKDLDFSSVVDLAAGHGRNSEKLKEVAEKIFIVDINQENIDYCQKRFLGANKFEFIKSDGFSLRPISNNSISLIYCFDAMVHFDSDIVKAYLMEFFRVLQPGGYGFCHHSNYTENPVGDFKESPHWRNFMSKQLFAHYCAKANLQVISTKVINWGAGSDFYPELDCLTLFRKSE